ncbi:membrane-associated protein, putative [Bodo saltans]|uniref:Membrane-associated protein, putative n=1 Tax=Bodo saltans TaxID=75058 RepID=A0A0S4J487_BODSA|nr:membrane-associated protein, putative [Bodo saltans]|eukprot:CUG75559.1 membrane-associated protein, putative [Bodo saltans]
MTQSCKLSSSSPSAQLHTQLLSLQLDCEAASNRRLRDARWSKQVTVVTTLFSVGAALASLPMISWQYRKLDRVWRLRHPIRARNYAWAAGVLCCSAVLVQVFQSSPIGHIAAYFKCFDDSAALDDVGMELRLLQVQLERPLGDQQQSMALLEDQCGQLQKRFYQLERIRLA